MIVSFSYINISFFLKKITFQSHADKRFFPTDYRLVC